MRLRVSLIMLPHSGMGGLAPSPKKLRAASSIIMVPMSSMEVTRMGPRILGRMCPQMIFPVPLPESRTAFIHWDSFWLRVWLRAILAYLGQEMAARAMMAFCSPPPRDPATARANTSPGKARNTSEIRISTVSVRPPTQPQVTPTAVPRPVMTATSNRVEKILVRLPAITLDSISRPYRSVPRGWALVGGCLAMSRFCR